MTNYGFSDLEKLNIIATEDGVQVEAIPKGHPRYSQLVEGIEADVEAGIEAVPPAVIAEFEAAGPTALDVKMEAGRRILDRYPDWYQRNMIAEAVTMAEIGAANRSAEHNARVVELNDAWAWVGAVRVRSNELEADLSLVQGAVSDDVNWPE